MGNGPDRESEIDRKIFGLDRWLHNLGLWRGPNLRRADESERLAALHDLDFSRALILANGAYDTDGQQIITMSSTSSYDEEAGIFEDSITYWRHLPHATDGGDHYVLSIQGKRDPMQNPEDGEVPTILPTQIIVNGSPVFSGTLDGGPHDPYWPKHRRMIDRVMEFSQRVKENLNAQDSIADLAQIMAGGPGDEDFLAMATGAGTFFEGLSSKGGFEDAHTPYFLNIVDQSDEDSKIEIFADTFEAMDIIHGGYTNTVENRSLQRDFAKSATHMESGLRFACERIADKDPETGDLIFRLTISPENVPHDMDAPPESDLVYMRYKKQDGQSYILDEARFMEGGPEEFESLGEQAKLIGFMNMVGDYLAQGKYPPFFDLAYKCRLEKHIKEMRTPPSLEKEGGEFLFVPLNGSNLEAQVGKFGASLGGGNMFMQRGVKEDGSISEVAMLMGLPFEPGAGESDWDGAQPDITPYLDALKKGFIYLDHDHFDHATLEFYAVKGILRGQSTICSARTQKIVEERMKKLGVTRDQWPNFINYDHPDMIPVGNPEDKTVAYPVKDEDSNIRAWAQFCIDGSKHTALTDNVMLTGCYKDQFYQDSYYLYNDAFDLKDHGWRFAQHGQEGLIGLPGVNEKNLRKTIKSEFEKYIALHDTTNPDRSGSAPTVNEVKNIWRDILEILPPDMVATHVPFSTNHLEIQALRELCAEAGIMRNTTSVGANAEMRSTCMNQFGVDPDINLRKVSIPKDKIPQAVYDETLNAIEDLLTKIEIGAEKRLKKRKDGATLEDILKDDVTYQVLTKILQDANNSDDPKAENIYRIMLSGDLMAYELEIQSMGYEAKDKPRIVPNAIYNHLKEEGKNLTEGNIGPHRDVAGWCLSNIGKNRKIKFETIGSWNETYMFQAIMNEQDHAITHATRTSETAKSFRDNLGELMILITGPTGTAEEWFATFSRYLRGESLLDYDEDVRPTAFQLDHDAPKAHFITQPPSTGHAAALGQQSMMRTMALNRPKDIGFLAKDDGFEIHNPGEHMDHILKKLKEKGYDARRGGTSSAPMIQVLHAPFHIGGHARHENTRKFVRDLPAKLHEAVHISSFSALQAFREIVRSEGKKSCIEKTQDHVTRKCIMDPKTGELSMPVQDYLTARYWQWRTERKFGQQYGGTVRGLQTCVMRDNGAQQTSGLHVRRDANGHFERHVAMHDYNAWLADFSSKASARRRMIGPDLAHIQPANQTPRVGTRSAAMQAYLASTAAPPMMEGPYVS